ncbi:MAG TPA: folylpolyglutamate synthase/dihydrofolate synthase family protein [Gemmatimonadaceae bacterium]|nr:folylpolyglutamate synthase/dihydrofolate synthase family protein [Gemmatimonadaceae bacterium]
MGVGLTSYQDSLDFLFARTTGAWKLGLERVEELLALLGNPHRAVPALHVAGTNGKGSVCAGLEGILRARGLRVGKYTSPHLVDFRERFVIDGAPVEPERIVDFVQRWTPEVERLGATFFEATTAMAFAFFREAELDVAVIETGLGGRLDATNVVTPLVAGVTNIGIDHVEYLGDTRERIAAEKAGIFKRGVPAVVGEPDRPIADLLATLAHERGAEPILRVFGGDGPTAVSVWADATTFQYGGRTWRSPLVGRHQAANGAVAIEMARALPNRFRPADDAATEAGLARAVLAGRFQRSGRYVFDVAHNPAGARVLADTLGAAPQRQPVVAVLSVLADKDWRGMMDALGPLVERFVLTVAPTSPPSRTWSLPEPLAYARERGWRAVVSRDFDRALVRAAEDAGTVLVTGSFHTVGDAMSRLEVSPTGG